MENNIEEHFNKTIEELTNGKFYVPTNAHSSGFNEVDMYEVDSNKPCKVYNIEEENLCDELLTFNQIIAKYPQFTLSQRFAFNGDFETWDRYKKALNNEIKICLLEI